MVPDDIPPLPLEPVVFPNPLGDYADLPNVLPADPPRPGFWGAVGWCLAFLGMTQVLPVLIFGMIGMVEVLSRPGMADRLNDRIAMEEISQALQAQILMPALIMAEVFSWLFSLLIIRLRVGRDWMRILAVRTPSPVHLGLVVLLLPAVVVLGNGFVELIRRLLPAVESLMLPGMEELIKQFAIWPWPIAVLVIGLGPGVGEELWCRGFLGRGLVGRYGFTVGVLLTSFLFGLIHIDPIQGTFAMLIGIVLHYVYWATRSLWAPMLLHFLNNSFAVTAPRLAALKELDESVGALPGLVYVAAAALLGALCWALYTGRARLEHRDPLLPPWEPDFPGVEYPPPGTGTVVVRPWPGWGPVGAVLGAVALFGAAVALAVG